MTGVYRLSPALQHYDWGMPDAIEAFLGLPVTPKPVAEAWWGAHASAPAIATAVHSEHRDIVGLAPDESMPLDAVIAHDPAAMLGVSAGGWERLPYLLKVLAIAKPLSLQVHPNLAQAEEGFAQDDARGLPLDDAHRTFKDRSHKPEMVVAVTDMTLLAGFRTTKAIARDLVRLGTPVTRAWAEELVGATETSEALRAYVARVLSAPEAREAVEALARVGAEDDAPESLRVAAATLHHFPGDAGALVALALNVVHLAPGEACFTDAGVIHSYQSGIGVEIMANSDNVVRAGLTPKHIDIELLLDLAVGTTLPPPVVVPESDGAITCYPAPVAEFSLAMVRDGEGEFPPGPRIVLAVDGEATLTIDGCQLSLTRGQSAFVPFHAGPLHVSATGTAAVAEVPQATRD